MVLGQNLAQIRSNDQCCGKVKKKALSLDFFHILLGEFLLKQKVVVVNTFTANYEYSRSNRENLPLPTEIKLSKKP